MKVLIFVSIFLYLAQGCFAQNPIYNKTLADSLGADELGMKTYIFVILKTGPKKEDNKARRDSLFRGHFANIEKLAKEGKLAVAGPFEKNEKSYRGLFILNVKNRNEAEKLLMDDPTIKEKIFELEFFEWYGSAALPMYIPYHNTIKLKEP